MAASLPGQMPYAASPFASDFDAAQNAALRKRRLADLLQQQAFQPDNTGLSTPGARMSWAVPLAKAMQAGVGTYMGGQADDADKANALARQAALEDLLKQGPPTGTPGQEAIAPSPAGVAPMAPPDDNSGAPPPPPGPAVPFPAMGPERPAIAAQPASPQDMMAYGAKFLPLGPAAAKVGEQFTDAAVKQMLPKTLSPEAIAELQMKHAEFQQTLQARIDDAKQRSEDRNASVEQRRDAAAESAALRRELAAQSARLRRELHDTAGRVKFGAPEGASERGNDIVRGNDGIPHEVIGGVPSPTPYAGPITPKAEQAKGVISASKGEQGLKDMASALQDVTDDPSLYGFRASVGAIAPAFGGLGAKVAGLSKDQLAKKSQIASMTADITHSLYGSAFSAGEQARAKGFLIDPTDSAEVVQGKLQGRMALEQEHYNNLPASAKAAATARKGGGGAGVDDLVNQYRSK